MHTPTPWLIEPYAQQTPPISLKVVHAVIKAEGKRLADVRLASDAAHIVRAVNNHDALVAACKAVEQAQRSGNYAEAFEAVRAALANATCR